MKVVRCVVGRQKVFGTKQGNHVRVWTGAPWEAGKPTKKIITFKKENLLAPCIPKKIIGVAINFRKGSKSNNNQTEPLVFFKNPHSIIGPNDKILSSYSAQKIWGECELGLVIGTKLKYATVAQAKKSIFGYVIANDVTAENKANWDHHLSRSKGPDTFCPIGPWIDTNYKPKGRIMGYHNNTLLRYGLAKDRVWKEPKLLVWLSSWMTLYPGDIILTGAPPRVTKKRYFSHNDEFKCKIDRLGELTNRFVFLKKIEI